MRLEPNTMVLRICFTDKGAKDFSQFWNKKMIGKTMFIQLQEHLLVDENSYLQL